MIERWGDRYCLIGPYNPADRRRRVRGAADRRLDPRDARAAHASTGIPCHFGRWLIPGRPRVILIDYRARFASLGHDKYLHVAGPRHRHAQPTTAR